MPGLLPHLVDFKALEIPIQLPERTRSDEEIYKLRKGFCPHHADIRLFRPRRFRSPQILWAQCPVCSLHRQVAVERAQVQLHRWKQRQRRQEDVEEEQHLARPRPDAPRDAPQDDTKDKAAPPAAAAAAAGAGRRRPPVAQWEAEPKEPSPFVFVERPVTSPASQAQTLLRLQREMKELQSQMGESSDALQTLQDTVHQLQQQLDQGGTVLAAEGSESQLLQALLPQVSRHVERQWEERERQRQQEEESQGTVRDELEELHRGMKLLHRRFKKVHSSGTEDVDAQEVTRFALDNVLLQMRELTARVALLEAKNPKRGQEYATAATYHTASSNYHSASLESDKKEKEADDDDNDNKEKKKKKKEEQDNEEEDDDEEEEDFRERMKEMGEDLEKVKLTLREMAWRPSGQQEEEESQLLTCLLDRMAGFDSFVQAQRQVNAEMRARLDGMDRRWDCQERALRQALDDSWTREYQALRQQLQEEAHERESRLQEWMAKREAELQAEFAKRHGEEGQGRDKSPAGGSTPDDDDDDDEQREVELMKEEMQREGELHAEFARQSQEIRKAMEERDRELWERMERHVEKEVGRREEALQDEVKSREEQLQDHLSELRRTLEAEGNAKVQALREEMAAAAAALSPQQGATPQALDKAALREAARRQHLLQAEIHDRCTVLEAVVAEKEQDLQRERKEREAALKAELQTWMRQEMERREALQEERLRRASEESMQEQMEELRTSLEEQIRQLEAKVQQLTAQQQQQQQQQQEEESKQERAASAGQTRDETQKSEDEDEEEENIETIHRRVEMVERRMEKLRSLTVSTAAHVIPEAHVVPEPPVVQAVPVRPALVARIRVGRGRSPPSAAEAVMAAIQMKMQVRRMRARLAAQAPRRREARRTDSYPQLRRPLEILTCPKSESTAVANVLEEVSESAQEGGDDFRVAMAATDGVGAVVAAMKRHETDAAVQEYGCSTLWNLAWPMQPDGTKKETEVVVACQWTIVQQGGLHVIVEAMRRHADHAQVMWKACSALSALVAVLKKKKQKKDSTKAPPEEWGDVSAVLSTLSESSSSNSTLRHITGELLQSLSALDS